MTRPAKVTLPPKLLSPRKDGSTVPGSCASHEIVYFKHQCWQTCFPGSINASLLASTTPGTTKGQIFQGHHILCIMENERGGAQENHGTALVAFVCKACCQGCKWLRGFVQSRKSTSEAKEFGNLKRKIDGWWQMREWHRQRGGKFSKILHRKAGN